MRIAYKELLPCLAICCIMITLSLLSRKRKGGERNKCVIIVIAIVAGMEEEDMEEGEKTKDTTIRIAAMARPKQNSIKPIEVN